MIVINSEQQQDVNDMRIELAQAKINLTDIRVSDEYSMHVKERVLDGLNKVTRELDALGVMHSAALRQHGVERSQMKPGPAYIPAT